MGPEHLCPTSLTMFGTVYLRPLVQIESDPNQAGMTHGQIQPMDRCKSEVATTIHLLVSPHSRRLSTTCCINDGWLHTKCLNTSSSATVVVVDQPKSPKHALLPESAHFTKGSLCFSLNPESICHKSINTKGYIDKRIDSCKRKKRSFSRAYRLSSSLEHRWPWLFHQDLQALNRDQGTRNKTLTEAHHFQN